MKETALDNKVYTRALDRLAEKIKPPTMDETMGRYVRHVGMEAMMAFEDEVDRVRAAEDQRLRDALKASRE